MDNVKQSNIKDREGSPNIQTEMKIKEEREQHQRSVYGSAYNHEVVFSEWQVKEELSNDVYVKEEPLDTGDENALSKDTTHEPCDASSWEDDVHPHSPQDTTHEPCDASSWEDDVRSRSPQVMTHEPCDVSSWEDVHPRSPQVTTHEPCDASSWEDDGPYFISRYPWLRSPPIVELTFLSSPCCSKDVGAQDRQEPPRTSNEDSSRSQRTKKKKQNLSEVSEECRNARRMAQNKLAAQRYRAKKKQKVEELQKCLEEEERQREKLKRKYNSLKVQISFIKKLILDTYVAERRSSSIVLD